MPAWVDWSDAAYCPVSNWAAERLKRSSAEVGLVAQASVYCSIAVVFGQFPIPLGQHSELSWIMSIAGVGLSFVGKQMGI